MAESIAISAEKNHLFGTNENDVVSVQQTTMATEEQQPHSTVNTHNDYYTTLIGTSGAGSVSALSLNDAIRTTANVPADTVLTAVRRQTATVTTSNTDSTEEERMIGKIIVANANSANKNQNNGTNNNNNHNSSTNNNNNSLKAKRRRRKSSKQKTNSKPYKKSNWNYQKRGRNGLSRLVPYNTNQFLMEEHMPEIDAESGRCRDSSFSFDSDNDKEEYLSKEFCNVYENARADRLYEMSKSQLIQEYLQLEASYDKLANNLGAQTCQLERSGTSVQVLKRLADRIQELTAENFDLRRQMADIRNRDRRHNSNTAQQNKSSHTYANRKANVSDTNNHNHNASSEDSESDSSSSSSSSSSNSSNSDSESDSSVSSRSRSPPSRTVSSKSSLMSGVSDNNQDADESSQLLFKHDCDSIDEPIDSNATPVDKITLS